MGLGFRACILDFSAFGVGLRALGLQGAEVLSQSHALALGKLRALHTVGVRKL